MNMRRSICFLLSGLLLAPPVLKAADDDLAVVVNKTNPADNLTKAQLRKLILGEQDSWPGGKKVAVILRASGQPERVGVLRSICGMSEDEFEQHLLHANFNGETGGAPKALGSGVAVRQLVATLPGGIGFIRPEEVNDSVKVVTVDGVAAGQPGYKVKSGK
jgi:phosphate transport system substrate-binding protein